MDDGKKKKLEYRDLVLLKRRWFPLWKLDGYILREFLIKYSVLMLVFIILFILNDVYKDISDFIEARASFRIVAWYLLCKLPGNIRFILPISMLLGCMWTMAGFGKNMEVTAMRASGVSLFRCGFSIFVVGLLVTGVNIYFNEAMIPQSEKRALEIYEWHARHRKVVQYHLYYMSFDGKRKWLFKEYIDSHDGNVQHDVRLQTYWSEEAIPQLIIGDPGDPEFADRVKLVFSDSDRAGRLLKLSDAAAMKSEMIKLLKDRKLDIYAETVEYDPEKKEWVFKNGNFISYDRNDETPIEESRGTIVWHKSPFKKLTFRNIQEEPTDISNFLKEKDDLSTLEILRLLRRNKGMHERVRAIYQTVFFHRLAFPWACFLAVFLGIPLATKNERTGSMLAIISAIGVIVIYIIVDEIFQVLGKDGYINPMLAGLMPTIGFISYGAWRILSDRN